MHAQYTVYYSVDWHGLALSMCTKRKTPKGYLGAIDTSNYCRLGVDRDLQCVGRDCKDRVGDGVVRADCAKSCILEG